jgi:hypothetical protein
MGDCRVELPVGVRVDLASGHVSLGESNTAALDRLQKPPAGAPTVTLSASMRMGQLLLE